MSDLQKVRDEMVRYLASTFETPHAPKEKRAAEYEFGVQHYSAMTTLELLEEYGTEKWKAGQDSMSYY